MGALRKTLAVCGRYALAGDWSEFVAEFDLEEIPAWTPRYNIAPTAGPGFEVPILKASGVELARFWYVPSWWTQPIRQLPTSFNARVETAFQKPFFRSAERCLVPTSGWREFPGPPKKKKAFHFHLPGKTEAPHPPGQTGFFAFCGITSVWTEPHTGESVNTFGILTTEPSEVVRPYHHRMPLLASPRHYHSWIDPKTDAQLLLPHCVKYSQQVRLLSYECSTYGNSTRTEGPACIAPIERQQSLF